MWYAQQIGSQFINGASAITPRLSIVKPIGAKWLMNLYNHFKANPDIIKNGFKASGITQVLHDVHVQ